MFNEILIRNDVDGVARLTMNSPDNLNALSENMLGALQDSIDSISENRDIRCVILAGAGKAFCAGHDLKELSQKRKNSDGGELYFHSIFKKCSKMMLSLLQMPQPVIAQVHGAAVAAGCQLVATCDMAVANEDTRFGVNGVNIGLFCSTPMVALTRNVSRKHAFEMLTTGALVDARRAEQFGLVNKVVEAGSLESETNEMAALVASKLGTAVKIGKLAFYKQAEMAVNDAYDYTGSVMVENMLHRDTKEGISAFLEKRTPEWKN